MKNFFLIFSPLKTLSENIHFYAKWKKLRLWRGYEHAPRARVRYGHLHFVLQLQNGYRYLHKPYSFGKHLLLSKKWRIERRIPFIKSISKNPMKKISYYHVMLNFSIFMTLSICYEKTVGDRKLKFCGDKVRPIANTRWDFGTNPLISW